MGLLYLVPFFNSIVVSQLISGDSIVSLALLKLFFIHMMVTNQSLFSARIFSHRINEILFLTKIFAAFQLSYDQSITNSTDPTTETFCF